MPKARSIKLSDTTDNYPPKVIGRRRSESHLSVYNDNLAVACENQMEAVNINVIQTKAETTVANETKIDYAIPMPDCDPGTNPYPKPPYSYATLIGKSIMDSEEKRARLSTIYAWIADNYPYYKLDHGGWQNSIRHNLTVNKCFVKDHRESDPKSGKGSFWKIHPEHVQYFEKGVFEKPRTVLNPVNAGSRRLSDIILARNRRSSSNLFEPSMEGVQEDINSEASDSEIRKSNVAQDKKTIPAKSLRTSSSRRASICSRPRRRSLKSSNSRFSDETYLEHDGYSLYSHQSDFAFDSHDDEENPLEEQFEEGFISDQTSHRESVDDKRFIRPVFFSVFTQSNKNYPIPRSVSESDLAIISNNLKYSSISDWKEECLSVGSGCHIELQCDMEMDEEESSVMKRASTFDTLNLLPDDDIEQADEDVAPPTIFPVQMLHGYRNCEEPENEVSFYPDIISEKKPESFCDPSIAPSVSPELANYLSRSTLFNSVSCPELDDLFLNACGPLVEEKANDATQRPLFGLGVL